MNFRVALQAESDLDEIWYFLATQSSSIDVADRVIDSITARFALVARQPYIGRRRDEDLRPGVRSFVVGDYVIAYRVDGDNDAASEVGPLACATRTWPTTTSQGTLKAGRRGRELSRQANHDAKGRFGEH